MGFPALAGGALALALPNQHLAAQETLGRVFGDGKSPCGNGDTQIPTYVGIGPINLRFPSQNVILAAEEALGRVFQGHKRPWEALAMKMVCRAPHTLDTDIFV